MKIKVLFLIPMLLILFGCANDNDLTPEKETLKTITYEVLLFEFTPDTGRNTSRLRYVSEEYPTIILMKKLKQTPFIPLVMMLKLHLIQH
jgi:hypothetical protein